MRLHRPVYIRSATATEEDGVQINCMPELSLFFFGFCVTPVTIDALIGVTKTPSSSDTYELTPGLDLRGDSALDVFP